MKFLITAFFALTLCGVTNSTETKTIPAEVLANNTALQNALIESIQAGNVKNDINLLFQLAQAGDVALDSQLLRKAVEAKALALHEGVSKQLPMGPRLIRLIKVGSLLLPLGLIAGARIALGHFEHEVCIGLMISGACMHANCRVYELVYANHKGCHERIKRFEGYLNRCIADYEEARCKRGGKN